MIYCNVLMIAAMIYSFARYRSFATENDYFEMVRPVLRASLILVYFLSAVHLYSLELLPSSRQLCKSSLSPAPNSSRSCLFYNQSSGSDNFSRVTCWHSYPVSSAGLWAILCIGCTYLYLANLIHGILVFWPTSLGWRSCIKPTYAQIYVRISCTSLSVWNDLLSWVTYNRKLHHV